MKKGLFTLIVLSVSLTAALAQPFFDVVQYKGAFDLNTSAPKSISLYGQTIKKSNGDTWMVNNGNWTQDWTNFDPQHTLYPGDAGFAGGTFTTQSWSGDIGSNTAWGSADGSLTLVTISGAIHVLDGATLTIYPNTVIRGDASNISFLLVAKGGKIYAVGTPDKPIIWTSIKAPGSRAAGDWAGFLIMGKSSNNTSPNGTGVRRFEALPSDPLSEYGGGANYNEADSSGVCRFMRVEFAGYDYLPDQEINGVTFGAVGNKTHFDFCQVSFSRDDDYEWFGGTINVKYLVGYAGIDDIFDQDEGYHGKCQFLLGVRRPEVFETSAGGSSHGFEHDNNTSLGSSAQNVVGIINPQPATRPIHSNVTLIGPRNGTNPAYAGNRFGAAMAFRTGDETCVYNSIATGWPVQFQIYHPSTTIEPSGHEKLLGGPLSVFAPLPNYTHNDVNGNVFIDDAAFIAGSQYANSNSSNGGIANQQANPANATFDPATGYYMAGGTPMDGTGIKTWINTTAFGNVTSNTVNISSILSAPAVGANPAYTAANFNPVLIDATYATGARFDYSNLANATISGNGIVSTPFLNVFPYTLPKIFIVAGAPSSGFAINVRAGNLTGTGISASVDNSNFQLSSDGTTWGATASLSLTSGGVASQIWVRYNNANVGSDAATVTILSGDSRASSVPVVVSGFSVAPVTPFVTASVAELPMFLTTGLSVPSTASTFKISGNLLKGDVTVTAPSNFEVSKDGSTYSAAITYSPSDKMIASSLVYVRYNPATATVSIIPQTTTTVVGMDPAIGADASITISSNGAKTESVAVNGSWSFDLNVGPLGVDGTVATFQHGTQGNIPAPQLQDLNLYAGTISDWVQTNIEAMNIPAGQGVKITLPAGYEVTTDKAVTPTPLTITLNGSNGVLPTTPVYIRYNATTLKAGLSASFKVGLTGTSAYDVIGKVTANVTAPSTSPLFSGALFTISGTNVKTALTTVTGGLLVVGLPIYNTSTTGFLGYISSFADDSTIVLDRAPGDQVGTLIYAPATTTSLVNMASVNVAANKDLNKAGAWITEGALSSISPLTFDAQSAAPVVVTVSGKNAYQIKVTRDLTTYYSLYFEYSLTGSDGDYHSSVTVTSTTGFINPTPVYVRYNPTGANASGTVNGVFFGPVIGQHAGSMNVQAYNSAGAAGSKLSLYLIGFSDPQLFASASPIPAHPTAEDLIATLADLNTIANTPSVAVPLYIYGRRLQGGVNVSATDSRFQFSTDAAFTSPQPSLSLSATNFTFAGTVYVRFNPGNTSLPGAGSITVSSVKANQTLQVTGNPIPVPQAFISSSVSELAVYVNSVGIFSVSGSNLTAPIAVTAPAGFQLWSGSGSYSNTLSLAPTSTNYGDLAETAIVVTFTGASSVSGSSLTLASGNASIVSVALTGGITNAVASEISSTEVLVYPNPTSGDVNVSFGTAVSASVIIYDVLGNVAYSTKGTESVYTISGLGKGLYIVKTVTSTGATKLSKLVVE